MDKFAAWLNGLSKREFKILCLVTGLVAFTFGALIVAPLLKGW